MRRLMSLAFVAAGLTLGAGCCHTCDVCDDCGGCSSDYGVYSQPSCTSCGGGHASKGMSTHSTTIASPVRNTNTR